MEHINQSNNKKSEWGTEKMKSLINVTVLLGILFVPLLAAADPSSEVQSLLVEIDKANQAIDANSRRITDNYIQLEKRVATFSGELTYAKEASTNINAKYEKIVEGIESIKSIWKKVGEIGVQQGKLQERLNSIETNMAKLEKDIAVSQTIVTWVTAIVSVVVILVGLFFSQRFLELYANYRVICSRLPKKEREGMGLKE